MSSKHEPGYPTDFQRDTPGYSAAGSHGGGVANPLINDSIFLAASEAIIAIDENQRIVMLNPAAQRMFGCSAVEVLGKDLSIFIPPRFHKAHARHVREFDVSGTVERPMGERSGSTLTGLRANGQEFPIQASISRVDVAGPTGARRYFTVLLRDVSEVANLRNEIIELNRRLQAIFEMAPLAIWIIDGDKITFANRACAELFGVGSHHDLVGRSIYSLLDPESRATVRRLVAQALQGGLPLTTDSQRIPRPDGTVRDVEIAIAALPDHGRMALQMVLTDITSKSEESRALEISRRELRALSASMVDAREEERRRIAREMHDELGQRLTALQMELSGLQSLVPASAAGARIERMLDMIDETIASVRRISTELRPLMLDDLGLIAAVEWLAQSWSQRMSIRVTADLGQQEPAIGASAAIAVYRMIQEALTNVARHARASRVKIRLRQHHGELELMVQDDGVGFSDLSAQPAGSHGLLGIRERAYMLGGHLEIDNARGGGARITVRLPLHSGGNPDPGDTDPAPRWPTQQQTDTKP